MHQTQQAVWTVLGWRFQVFVSFLRGGGGNLETLTLGTTPHVSASCLVDTTAWHKHSKASLPPNSNLGSHQTHGNQCWHTSPIRQNLIRHFTISKLWLPRHSEQPLIILVASCYGNIHWCTQCWITAWKHTVGKLEGDNLWCDHIDIHLISLHEGEIQVERIVSQWCNTIL